MSKIKVAELFYSIQGEGRYMGVPSVFLRTFGCNFQCAGFGLPHGEKTTELDSIIARASEYKSYGELPLVATGCDSYASWHPAFKKLSPTLTTDQIVSKILSILPNNEWGGAHLVITGGEPLLGWQRAYPDLLSHDDMVGLTEITFETNGTQELTDPLIIELNDWMSNAAVGGKWPRGYDALTFSVSPKLSVSGEKWEEAIRPDVVCQYEDIGYTYLKFVVATEQDVEEALTATSQYRAGGFSGPVYLMPVGGTESVYTFNNRRVAELAMKHGLRYSDRLQVPLFKNEWGT